MHDEILNNIFVFVLSGFIGFELIKRVSPLLHTPLMSLTNALSSISIIGGLLIVGESLHSSWIEWIGVVAVIASTINIVSGFMITDRILKMFKNPRK
jgi:NAD(P) transhydrogenase subunit alpha